MTFTLATYRRMLDNAPYSYPTGADADTQRRERIANAIDLARLLGSLRGDLSVWISWEPDDNAENEDEYACLLLGGPSDDVLVSLGGIDAESGDPYRDVVEAQLYGEELQRRKAERPGMCPLCGRCVVDCTCRYSARYGPTWTHWPRHYSAVS